VLQNKRRGFFSVLRTFSSSKAELLPEEWPLKFVVSQGELLILSGYPLAKTLPQYRRHLS
jgi:hypothetical protein